MAKKAVGGKGKQKKETVGAAAATEALMASTGEDAAAVSEATREAGELSVVMEFLPENIIINERIEKLRDWNGETKQEMTIPQLAQSILDDGQTDAGTVWETEDGFVLLSGHRRRRAIMLLREQGHEILFKAVVHPDVKTEEQALHIALHANEMREDFNDMERAAHISLVREIFGWEGEEHTAEVAGFLGKDPATVTQLERLKLLAPKIQDEVRAGRMTRSTALEYLTTPAEKMEAVHDKATEIAQEKAKKKEAAKIKKEEEREAARAAKAEKAPKNKKDKQPPIPAAQVETMKAAKREKAEREKKRLAEAAAKATPTGADVRKAQTEVDGGSTKLKAPKMAEGIEFFEGLNRKGMPESMVAFADAFAQYGHGKLSVKDLGKAWKGIENEIYGKEMEKAKAGVAKIPAKPESKPKKKGVRATVLNNKPVVKKATAKKSAKPAKKK